MGESRRKEEYFCFAENYCACYSFFYDIVNRGEQLCVRSHSCLSTMFRSLNPPSYYTFPFSSLVSAKFLILNYFCFPHFQCKHQLAARLALSLGAFIEVEVSDEQLAVLLSKL